MGFLLDEGTWIDVLHRRYEKTGPEANQSRGSSERYFAFPGTTEGSASVRRSRSEGRCHAVSDLSTDARSPAKGGFEGSRGLNAL